jgi:hypothetical protein
MALTFNGSTSRVAGAFAPGQDHGFTVSCWFRLDHADSHQALIWIGDDDLGSMDHLLFAPQASTGTGIRARSVNSFPAAFAETGNAWSPGTWHHACATFAAADERRVVLDGNLAAAGSSFENEPISGIDRISIGQNGGSGSQSPAAGAVAEVAVWNEPLSDDQIVALARGAWPLAVRPSALTVYQDFVRRANRPGVGPLFTQSNTGVAPHPRVLRRQARIRARWQPPAPSPLYRVAAGDVYVPSAAAGDSFVPSAVAGEIHSLHSPTSEEHC